MLQLNRSSRSLVCVVPLLVLLLSACATSTVRPAPTEPAFLSTQIAVIAPEQIHPGDPISVIVKLDPLYQPNGSFHNASCDIGLYGPFPSRTELQSAITAGTAYASPLHHPLLGGMMCGGNTSTSFSLPQSLAPGTYDLVVTASLAGSRATARSDTPIQITAR